MLIFRPPADIENRRYLDRLQRVFGAMDRSFDRAAAFYGFSCNGCTDNCCRSLFYHYTHLEYGCLRQGFSMLSRQTQTHVTNRAQRVRCRQAEADNLRGPPREMCPLNADGLCLVYAHRPMICRLHGLPHELKKPGQTVVYGGGCETFDCRCGHKTYFPFDRTPFYQDVAQIEREFKQHLGTGQKIRMTVAQMIVSFSLPLR